jgi:hypothetical protein
MAVFKLEVYAAYNYDRNCTTINTFATESQAEGSLALAMLSQQLADFNGEWEPQWGEGTVDLIKTLQRLLLF